MSEELDLIKSKRSEQLLIHYVMLSRQMTHLCDCFTHIIRLDTNDIHGSKGLDIKGYRAYAQSEISDMLVQTKKLCDILEIDFVDTYTLGLKRDIEKEKLYKENHPNDKWI
jgi:hypothetical protein